MKVFSDVSEVDFKHPIVVLGNFDGCHLGHQELIRESLTLRMATGRQVLLVTFDPHPRKVDGKPVLKLQTLEEKLAKLEHLGVDGVLVIPFTTDFLEMSYGVFVEDVLVRDLQVSSVVVGYNYRFGHKGLGDVSYLEKMGKVHGYYLLVVPAFKVDDFVVSSSYIRLLLKDGKIESAARLLGNPFSIEGEVIHGAGEGRKVLGYPTANLEVDEEKLIPRVGVYVAFVEVDEKKYRGILNVGYQPTFDRKRLAVEVHILDFDRMIYGERIKVSFIHYLRGEKKFSSKEELISQLKTDAKHALTFSIDE